MTHTDPHRTPDARDADQILHAERELTRQELADTVAGLAYKADLPARSRHAAQEYQARAGRAALRVGERATLRRAALGGGLVLAIAVALAARPKRRPAQPA